MPIHIQVLARVGGPVALVGLGAVMVEVAGPTRGRAG